MKETIDLDGPEPTGEQTVRFGGTEYPVRDHLDIPMEEIEEMLTIQTSLAGKPWHEQLAMARRQVQILVPSLPEPVLRRLTGRQIVKAMVELMGMVPIQEAPAAPSTGVEPGKDA